MSSSNSSQESGSSSPAQHPLGEPTTISSHLQIIPYHKLTNLKFINKGAYGTVHSAVHSDWRIPVAVKFFPTERHLLASEREKILKEAEILHKARFSYILPILGICYQQENIGIVTEYMTSGSLYHLLFEENPSPAIVWPLRFRILYEIALGVNFLHNLTPPLLHHDLKTHNILLDSEFHVKIADFGLSKWRMLSQSHSDNKQTGGTIIYMPPEMYELSPRTSRGSVKHDMYSYAIIMWEVLSRKQPFEGAVSQMQIMYSVTNGARPDTSNESLPDEIPDRNVFVTLMQTGWATDPNERPSFLKCLLELEPIVRTYDDISILEGILHIKRVRSHISNIAISSQTATYIQTTSNVSSVPFSSLQLEDKGDFPSFSNFPSPTQDHIYPVGAEGGVTPPPPYDPPQGPEKDPGMGSSDSWTSPSEQPCPTLTWVQKNRDIIVQKMTDACLNQCLDALISKRMILKEDYELVKSEPTRTAKVRKLMDTCDIKGEIFAKIIVKKLMDNKQSNLQPFPDLQLD